MFTPQYTPLEMLKMVELIKWEEGREGGRAGGGRRREGRDGLEREGRKGREGDGRDGGKGEGRNKIGIYIYHNYKRTILYHSAYTILDINYKYVGLLRTSLD